MAGSLDATHPELTWGFRQTLARLERMADEQGSTIETVGATNRRVAQPGQSVAIDDRMNLRNG